MKVRASRNVKVLSVSILLSSAMIAGGIAYAAGDTITACVKKSNGTTRIISGKMKCTKYERQISWGSTGDQGPAGATGATGAAGTNGVSTVYKKSDYIVQLPYNYGVPIMSAVVPAGKYQFQFNSELSYFNNSTATNKTRYVACLITTNSDNATAFAMGHENEVLWPKPGTVETFRTGIAPSAASADAVDMQTYNASGTLNLASQTTIYYQCMPEVLGGDNAVSGQLHRFVFPTLTLIKTNEITTLN